jgi:hypothetical protein
MIGGSAEVYETDNMGDAQRRPTSPNAEPAER